MAYLIGSAVFLSVAVALGLAVYIGFTSKRVYDE